MTAKKLTASRRAELETTIKRRCQWAVGVVDVQDIDRLNIFGATMLAMTLAVEALCAKLGCDPLQVLVDGNLTPQGRRPEWRWAARAIVGGDAIEPCISAASIIAKEHRDRMMRAAALIHHEYGWDANKGYGHARTSGSAPGARSDAIAPQKLRAGVADGFALNNFSK